MRAAGSREGDGLAALVRQAKKKSQTSFYVVALYSAYTI
jgi:hypothetical protein